VIEMPKMKIRPEDLIMIEDENKRVELETEFMKAKELGRSIIKFDGMEYTTKYVEELLEREEI
jgi:hypothetical protein